MGEIRVPVLVKAQGGAVQGHGLECQVGLGATAATSAVGGRQGHGLQGLRGGHDRQRRQQVAGAPDHQQRGPRPAGFLGGWGRALLVLLGAVRALMLLDVAAEDEGMSGLEQALFAAEGLARGVLQLLVQVEIVLAFAAVAALVTVEGPLPGVHAHVLDELVGGLGQVAALVALVVVAQAMRAGVRLQLQLVGLHRLADPALVLHLVVGLHVALHGGRAVGGINAEWAPAGGGGGKQGRERVSPTGSREVSSPAAPRLASLPSAALPAPRPDLPPAQPGPATSWGPSVALLQTEPSLSLLGGCGVGWGGLLAAPGDASPQEGEQSQCRVGGGRPAKLFSPPGPPARPLGALPASHQPRPRAHPQDLPSRWEQHKESTFHAPHQAHAERLRVLKNSL